MTKSFINILFALLIPLSAYALNDVDRQVIDEETLLVNGGFENGKAEWVQSGGTFSIVTSSPMFGKAHATFQASGSGQYIETALKTIPQGLKGKNCIARQAYENGDGNLKMQVMDGSSAVLAEVVLVADTLSAEANFICPSSGSLKIRTVSTAASAAAKLDKYKLGLADNLRGVSQAVYIGSVNFSGCTTSPFNSSGSFASMTGTGCTITASGGVQTTGGQTVALVLPSGGPGLYQLELEGMFGSSAAANITHFQGYDGSNTSQDQASFMGYAGYGGNHTSLTIKETSALSNVTFEIRGKKDGSGDPTVVATSPYNATLKLYYWPSQEQIAVNSNCVGTANCENTFSATISASGVVSGENVDFINGNCSIGTEGGGEQTATCTFNSSLFSATPNCTLAIEPPQNRAPGFYSLSSSVAKITEFAPVGNANYFDVPVKIICSRQASDRKPQMPVPILVGSVSSNTASMERVERLLVGSTCSTSPCTITSQSGSWVTSVTRTGTGAYTLNFAAGMFSAAPTCTCASILVGNVDCQMGNASTTSIDLSTIAAFANSPYDTGFNIICMGPK